MKKLVAILGFSLVLVSAPGCEESNTVLKASEEELAEYKEKEALLEESGGAMSAVDGGESSGMARGIR